MFLVVPLAQGQRGFLSGEGSVCSGTQDGICSQRHLLKTGKLLVKKCQVATLSINKDLENEIVKAYKLSTEKKQIKLHLTTIFCS